MLRVKNINEIRSFIAMNLNFSTLRNTPNFQYETPSGQGNSLKIETDSETIKVSYNRDFNLMTLDVTSKKAIGLNENENKSVVKRASPAKIERPKQVINKDSYESIVTFAERPGLEAISEEENDSNLAQENDSDLNFQ